MVWYDRLSSGVKMLLILGLALFPFGLVAILASVESARESARERDSRAHAQLTMSAQRIDAAIARDVTIIRTAAAAVALSAPRSGVCEATLARLVAAQPRTADFALYDVNGAPRCATRGFLPVAAPSARQGGGSLVRISADGGRLDFTLFDASGQIEGIGEVGRAQLTALARGAGRDDNYDLALVDGARTMPLHDGYSPGAFDRTVTLRAPVLGGRLGLRIAAGRAPFSIPELLTILLPVLMWLGGAAIGWMLIDRLLLRPLKILHGAVSAYRPGDTHIDLPAIATPAREITALGETFDRVTRTIAGHESDLEAAVERQTKLVREVHHRVKNNLQVVASLLNIHARGSRSDEVAAAYASIQRRVDALAIVHRNHYAELEENRGVALKPLIAELAANLRANAPPAGGATMIRLAIDPCSATQDVAVSVAFLITEVAEFAMMCAAPTVTVSLRADGGRLASLRLATDSLREGQVCDAEHFTRFERIVTGLSRQLRSTPARDLVAGSIAIDIAVATAAPAGDAATG